VIIKSGNRAKVVLHSQRSIKFVSTQVLVVLTTLDLLLFMYMYCFMNRDLIFIHIQKPELFLCSWKFLPIIIWIV